MPLGNGERRWPSDARLRERAVRLLTETALFRHVSRRLLADMVAHYGLTELDRMGGTISGIVPAILLVLEGSVDVVLPTTPGIPPTVLNLPIGSYSRTVPGVQWGMSTLRAGGTKRVRVFLIDREAFLNDLPQMLVNQLAPVALQAL
jgi:hypothetical protein